MEAVVKVVKLNEVSACLDGPVRFWCILDLACCEMLDNGSIEGVV